ncbi:MAG: hypothetical protein K9J12_14505 [Melioribacteraceae bacterium]|nr:hypothetical protein [Melioribacteraceae bacterium]MCF8412159.1 hypothetical protein [Melioribacteraceae bacterium]MCF8431839.1 hypothetical protein [Melioribacteraceae bacterium]
MEKSRKNIYLFPKPIQWSMAVIVLLMGAAVLYLAIEQIYFPLILILVPILKPIAHFSLAPILRLTGFLKYYSPMLLGVKMDDETLEIHNGNSFDYLINMKWKHRGDDAKKQIMIYYLMGLLKIIDEIERNNLQNKLYIVGVSYFLSQNTIRKLGFEEETVRFRRKFLFFVDYINLFLMYSYANGRMCFPNVFELKKVKISANKLIASKTKIFSMLNSLKHRYNLSYIAETK